MEVISDFFLNFTQFLLIFLEILEILIRSSVRNRNLVQLSSFLSSSHVKDVLNEKDKKLFKFARSTKRSQTYDSDKIDEARALAEFHVTPEDLA